ncbi:hypothetical protein Tsubulata_006067 [Turnera subulata]|uniref:TauD/TfdA-like domain-containing protein n=1 Tax=Turnera subulata TaxID=218843 RepID=A0A9Q0FI12_9ROSI|nr:hypothetical protein Tsubulata_006067 [Turnera subulata]
MANIFKEIQIPQQKQYDSIPFPSVLSPSVPSPSLSLLMDAIKAQKPFLESLLFNAGALLFRGFPVSTASDFNDVVEAFGYEELAYNGGVSSRTKVVGRVYTANESPLDQNIPPFTMK